jgi:acetyl-CoA carboxylase carboxyltransferase component
MEKYVEERIYQLKECKARALLGGGEDKLAKQRAKGKLNARERLDVLLDPGSFVEFNMLVGHLGQSPGDGVVAGYGTINGRIVCVYSQDPTVKGGSIGPIHGYKMYRTVERALEMKVPFIGLHDSPGARMPRLEEGGGALGIGLIGGKNGGSIFFPNTQASGVIPQISAIMGSCAGISVYSPALTDFIFMIDGISQMFITGAAMVRSVMGENVTAEELGGAAVHCKVSGVADMRVESEQACLQRIRDLVDLLPANHDEAPPRVDYGDDPDRIDEGMSEIVTANPIKPYDMHKVINSLVDSGYFFEIKPEFAGGIIVGFGRLDGNTVGIVANQPTVRAGSLTVDSSGKQARFIRFCDSFKIPIVLLVDTPAYMPGTQQEHTGIIRHGAKVLYALCEASVPRKAVVLRKAYGGGNLGMGIVPGLGTDIIYFWPTVEMGVLGAKQSVELFYRSEISKAENPEEVRAQKLKEYTDKYANPIFEANSSYYIDDIIEPRETRRTLIRGFKLLASKDVHRRSKRHGNIPL